MSVKVRKIDSDSACNGCAKNNFHTGDPDRRIPEDEDVYHITYQAGSFAHSYTLCTSCMIELREKMKIIYL